MKVVLVNPPWKLGGDSVFSQVGAVYPPLGLAYVAASLESIPGIEIKIIDGFAEGLSLDEYGKKIKDEAPDVVGMTAYTITFLHALATAKKTKEVLPNCTIIFGGPHPTILPDDTIAHDYVDIVVRGEGDITSQELFTRLRDHQNLNEVLGVSFKDGKKVIHNPPRPLMQNLDTLPFPSYNKLPMDLYKPSSGTFRRSPSASMITSRGCPFNCVYCSKAIFGRSFRARSAEKVVSEMEYLIQNYNIREITFQDDVFTMDTNRTEDICKLIIEKKLDITWSCNTRVNLVSESLLKLMKDAGCVSIEYGIESGDTDMLKFMRKGISIDQAKKALRLAKGLGIETRVTFIFGMPGESRETVKKTMQLLHELNPDFVLFNIAIPFPGTELYDIVKREGKLIYDKEELYSKTDGAHALIRLDNLTEQELVEIYKKATEEYYMRLSYILGRIFTIKSIDDVKRYKRGFFEVLKWISSNKKQ